MLSSEGESSSTRLLKPEPLSVLLRRWRLANGLSQEALAEKAGLSVNGIAQLETGKRTTPRPETLRLIAEALELDSGQRMAMALAARPNEAFRLDVLPAGGGQVTGVAASLPASRSQLIGRDADRHRVVTLLRSESTSLLTLVGPGGVGKTRLALAVAHELVSSDRSVVWVELASISDPVLILSTIGDAIGVRERPARPLMEALVGAFVTIPTVLVLDNCEHLRGGIASLASRLLQACPLLRILATSRVPLHVHEEQLVAIEPLTLPDMSVGSSPDALVTVDAVALFLHFARKVRPEFQLTEQNAADVVSICCQLDGLPLALELAAARLRALPIASMLALLQERLSLLTGGAVDMPIRQQSLRETIRWSYDLLGPEWQSLFRQLGVFAGGALFEDVADVIGIGDSLVLLEGLETIIDHSLLVIRGEDDGQPRYFMLETVRAFAREELRASGEDAVVEYRYAEHFAGMVFRITSENAYHADTIGIMEDISREWENVSAAYFWALRHRPELALRMATALVPFWYFRGRVHEGWEWMERALSEAEDARDHLRAVALALATLLAIGKGDIAAALRTSAESVRLLESQDEHVDDSLEFGLAILQRGNARFWSGDLISAQSDYEVAFQRFQRLGLDSWKAQVLIVLGAIAVDQQDLERAEQLFREALALGDRDSNVYSHSFALRGLADVFLARGLYAEARSAWQEALQLSWILHEPSGVTDCLVGIAEVASSVGQEKSAALLLGAARGIRESSGLFLGRWETGYMRACVATRRLLGEESFAAAWSEGQAWSIEQAVSAAIAVLPDEVRPATDRG